MYFQGKSGTELGSEGKSLSSIVAGKDNWNVQVAGLAEAGDALRRDEEMVESVSCLLLCVT